MSFLSLIVKNLIRQRVRTGLTVLGISLGITTVVALGVVTHSLKASAGQILHLGGADFMVAQKGAADLSFSIVSEEDVAKLAQTPDVEYVEGILFHITRIGTNPFFFLGGREADGLARNPPTLVEGRLWGAGAANQIILGRVAAADLGAGVGDSVTIEGKPFEVVGIYDSSILYERSGGYAPLRDIQEMASRTGVVTAAFVTVQQGADPQGVAAAIEAGFPGLVTIADIGEYGKVDQGVTFLDAANIGISVLAVGIGAIGVMNTMVMSVFERTREIGILRAVGWSGQRILRMIIGEAVLLCLIAAVVGSALGVLATRAILLIDTVRTLLVPEYGLDVFARALLVAVIVALVGAIYPAFRSVRLAPMEALRYE